MSRATAAARQSTDIRYSLMVELRSRLRSRHAFTLSVDLMGGEPLRPEVRASLLRLLADTVPASGPDASFIDMGTVTDRAGHTAVAIGFQTPAVAPAPVSLHVLVFDPATGALLGEEYAYCQGRVGSYPASGSCFPTSYTQLVQIKAVPAIPAKRVPSPSDSPES